jgi:hypothetical protein
MVRYIHVGADESETEFVTAPADLPVIKVTLGRSRKSDRSIIEETITKGEWPPPGRGWELVSGRNNQSRWQRRRRQVWQTPSEGSGQSTDNSLG